MKKIFNKIIGIPLALLILLIVLVVVVDSYVMPWYVNAEEYVVPKVVGLELEDAKYNLKQKKLKPIESNEKFNENFPKGFVIHQVPGQGSIVKEGRRVYLVVSSGDPLVTMPNLVGKTMRDAKITIERLDIQIDTTEEVESEMPANTVVEQEYDAGTKIPKGTAIDLRVSVGPKIGMIRVPNLLGKSYSEAERILRNYSLRIGQVNYQNSPNLLPNTVIDQYPTQDKLISVGDSVDIIITRSVDKNEAK
jgi:serine/threonine-protein kinase